MQIAWCLFDWAYSAYSTVVTTFVFATYFVRAVAPSPAAGTSAWAAAQAVAGLIIACLALPVGAIADQGGRRPLLGGAIALMVAATACLWFVRPQPEAQIRALALVATGTVSFEIATVFYNAMLQQVASPGRVGKLSGIAWGLGYVGGLICLVLCLIVLINPKPPLFGLSQAAAEPVRATCLFAAGWIAFFSWPVVVFAPPTAGLPNRPGAVRRSLANLTATLSLVWKTPQLRSFLLARMLYTDGLTTLFAFGAIFAAGTFGMGAKQVLVLGIVLNVSAGIGALALALIEDSIGSRPTVLIAVMGLTLFGFLALCAPDVGYFWAAAVGLGLFVGPAQSASRSLMAQIADPQSRNAMFGLYALSGRLTGFVGPAALGAVTALTGSQRAGMASILLLLITGWFILLATPIRPTIA